MWVRNVQREIRASQNWSWKHFLKTKQRLWSTSTHSSTTHLIKLAGLKQLGGPVASSLCSEWQKKCQITEWMSSLEILYLPSALTWDTFLSRLIRADQKWWQNMSAAERELWYGKLLYSFKQVAVCIQNTDSTVGRILCQWMFSM